MNFIKKHSMVWLPLVILLLTISFMSVKPALAQTTTLFVDPARIVDQTKQSGSAFTVYINISDVVDLYTYQVTIMWDPTMLEIPFESNITYGNIFEGQLSFPFLRINNAEGWVMVGESLSGYVPGVSGSGWLFSIEFLVEKYGRTELAFDFGTFRDTYLLDSWGFLISFTAVDGYFSNTILSDIRGPENPPGSGLFPPDGVVDMYDFGFFGLAYGKSSADPDWNDYKIADIRGPENPPGSGLFPPDGVVDMYDFGYCGLEYGSSI